MKCEALPVGIISRLANASRDDDLEIAHFVLLAVGSRNPSTTLQPYSYRRTEGLARSSAQAWNRSTEMGLSLKRPARFAPREPRAAIAVDSLLLLPDDQVVTITIRNISSSGFMAYSVADLQPGTGFGVAIPGCGIVRASVRWNEAGVIGAQFDNPLGLERLEKAAADEASRPGFLDARIRRKPSFSLRTSNDK